MTFNFFHKNKQTIAYGIALATLLLLLKWLEWHFIIVKNAYIIYAIAIALIFTTLGVWLAVKLVTRRVNTIIVEKQVFVKPDAAFTGLKSSLKLSARELDVLQLMADGLSNKQIAERLFVSLNTIKTHTSNLYSKLEVESRTQAVEKARRAYLLS